MKLELKHLAPYLPYRLKVSDGKETTVLTLRNSDDLQFAVGFKPILRPLSDYTEDYANFWNYSFINFKWAIINKEVSVLTFQDLLKNHYDVFGLIEKGLAININTIK